MPCASPRETCHRAGQSAAFSPFTAANIASIGTISSASPWIRKIGGRDLIERGLTGAQIGAGLEKATIAMLEDRAPDRDSQLDAALS